MGEWVKWGLGLIWLSIGVVAGIRAARGAGRGGYLCAVLGLALATAVTLRWHVEVLFAARGLLRGLDLYSSRAAIKIVIAVLLGGAIVVGFRVWGHRLLRQPKGLRLAMVTMLVFAAFLFALTAFLDALLPGAIRRPPGRHLLELGFAGMAAFGIGTWRDDARRR